MSDDDGPPPLDDMSEYVNKLTGNKVQYSKVEVSQNNAEVHAQCTYKNLENFEEVPTVQSKSEPVKKPVNRGYAGMKKGFLSGGLSKPKSGKPKVNKITEIKANPKAKNEGLKLKEVQDKMAEANQFLSDNSNDWLSDDLLRGIQTNEKINSKLNNPQFMAAFSEFQTNPQAAAKKYGDNAEMKEFIQEFSGLMGNHFTSLAEKQEAKK